MPKQKGAIFFVRFDGDRGKSDRKVSLAYAMADALEHVTVNDGGRAEVVGPENFVMARVEWVTPPGKKPYYGDARLTLFPNGI